MKTWLKASGVALTLALCLSSVPASAQEVQVSEKARQHFKTGVAYLTDPDGARYDEAYREFKAAYADSPSWKILGNLGITAMKLERDGEAVDAFERYLAAGGAQIDPSERAQMERDLMTTKAGLVWVSVRVEPPVASITDERQGSTGRAVSNYYTLGQDGTIRVGVRSGRHKMTARATGFQDQVWEFDASPGPELTREFRLEKPTVAPVPVTPQQPQPGTETTSRPIGTPVIIAATATGVLLLGSGVVGVLAMGKKSDFDDVNDGSNPEDAQKLKDSGQTLNIVADVMLGGAIVGAAVTTYLFINRPEVKSAGADTASLRVVPTAGPTGGGVFMTGRF